MAFTSRCLPMRTRARPKSPLQSRCATSASSARATGGTEGREASSACMSGTSWLTYVRHTAAKARKKATSCSCRPRTSCWQEGRSGPRRLSRGWQSVRAMKPCMIRACSVLAISSRTSSRPESLDSCRRLHSPCSRKRPETRRAAAAEKIARMAPSAVRQRKAMKSFVSRRGSEPWSLRRASRTEWMQETSTRVGGHFSSTSAESHWQSSSTRLSTKSGSRASSMEPSVAAIRPSCSFRKPSTASQRWGT
mmetsp:Transcript_4557/g.14144  ORF Transcript_4557/g.14144 Transcript_4557/m.14144 type:complete len:250 (-) Transcript_4557:215-964(-)